MLLPRGFVTGQVLKERNTEDLYHLVEVSKGEDCQGQRELWANRPHTNPEALSPSHHLSKLKEDAFRCPGQNVHVSIAGSNPAKATFTPDAGLPFPRQKLPHPHQEKPVKQALQGQPQRGNEIFI